MFSAAAHLEINCIPVEDNPENASFVQGQFLLTREEPFTKAFLENFQTRQQILIAPQDGNVFHDFRVSPNGNWIVYLEDTLNSAREILERRVILLSADGTIKKSISTKITFGISRWLDPEHVVLTTGGQFPTQIVLDPFDETSKEISYKIDDGYNLMPNGDWQGQSFVVYNPGLTQLVYAGLPADLVLVNLKNQQVAGRISPAPIADSVPKWSPEGDKFVTAYLDLFNSGPGNLKEELYLVNGNGELSQLTYLAEYYRYSHILSYEWSPDGQYIAFWLETDEKTRGKVQLSVLDTMNSMVVNYCVLGTYKQTNVPPPIFWSPTSQQVAVQSVNPLDSESQQIVVLDVLKEKAVKITEKAALHGWVVGP